MNVEQIIKKTAQYVKETLTDQEAGHDWWHIERVRTMALRIAKEEGADILVVELSALLHDIADHKFHGGDETVGPRVAREWLERNKIDPAIIVQVVDIVAHQSYTSSLQAKKELSLEGKVVQDADRLDAIGAIGIARTMSYVGSKGLPIYDPTDPVKQFTSAKEYKSTKSTSINHFYEKLLLLKDKMNTETGKQLAEPRHKYMETYLDEFFSEWKGKL